MVPSCDHHLRIVRAALGRTRGHDLKSQACCISTAAGDQMSRGDIERQNYRMGLDDPWQPVSHTWYLGMQSLASVKICRLLCGVSWSLTPFARQTYSTYLLRGGLLKDLGGRDSDLVGKGHSIPIRGVPWRNEINIETSRQHVLGTCFRCWLVFSRMWQLSLSSAMEEQVHASQC